MDDIYHEKGLAYTLGGVAFEVGLTVATFGGGIAVKGATSVGRLTKVAKIVNKVDKLTPDKIATKMLNIDKLIPDELSLFIKNNLDSLSNDDILKILEKYDNISPDDLQKLLDKLGPEDISKLSAEKQKVVTGVNVTVFDDVGEFVAKNESMSPNARNYQNGVPGAQDGMVYRVNGVDFDGFDPNIGLIDAKANYGNLVDENGFVEWFSPKSRYAIVDQANRQIKAAGNTPITWYFQD